jgi:hypothetical protein
MPRVGNYPTTIEDVKTITLTKLKEWNYLTNGTKSGVISWSRNGEVYSTIDITLCLNDNNGFLLLNYNYSNENFNYKVRLISKPSNLGKGEILYFVCPSTGKFCRKLYFKNSYFLHRTAFKEFYYSKQIESKKYRNLTKIFEKCFISDEVYFEREKKYFKTHYNGKPTKRFLKLEKKIQTAESYPPNTLQSLLMS